MRSIRRRLMLPLAGLYVLGWLGTAGYAYYQARHEVDELFDGQLLMLGNTLYSLIRHEILENEQPLLPVSNLPTLGEPHHDILFQIVHGDVVINSSDALSEEVEAPPGLANVRAANGRWRVYSMSDSQHGFRVHVLEPLHIRAELSNSITLSLVTPLLLVIPALLLLSWLIIGDALRPLYRIGRVVETRSPEDLSPIGGQDAPREIRPLVGAIDRLLERLRQALERERRFTADAAHELRTPLAALKAQAEVAQRARDPRERTNALRQIDNGVERTTHLIEQLLTLARLEPDSSEALEMRPVSLCPLIEDAVANLFPNALRKHIDLGLQSCGCDGKPVLGNATTLGILLCNLIGNAIRYTPEGGRIDIRTHLDAGRVSLEVADTGPGIPPQQRKRVFERFYRANEHRKTDGSGLGLSIVARIVELHGAEITLSETSDSGGLTVAVAFPRADSGGIDASRGQKKKSLPGRGRLESAISWGRTTRPVAPEEDHDSKPNVSQITTDQRLYLAQRPLRRKL